MGSRTVIISLFCGLFAQVVYAEDCAVQLDKTPNAKDISKPHLAAALNCLNTKIKLMESDILALKGIASSAPGVSVYEDDFLKIEITSEGIGDRCNSSASSSHYGLSNMHGSVSHSRDTPVDDTSKASPFPLRFMIG